MWELRRRRLAMCYRPHPGVLGLVGKALRERIGRATRLHNYERPGRNRLSRCEYPCAMGLLQRFARPEYRTGREPEPAQAEHPETASAPEHAAPSTPPSGGPDEGGGSVYGSDAFSQEVGASDDAPPAESP